MITPEALLQGLANKHPESQRLRKAIRRYLSGNLRSVPMGIRALIEPAQPAFDAARK